MALWLANAKNYTETEITKEFKVEPVIPAQDGYYEIKAISLEAASKITFCYLPENQLLYYRKNKGYRCVLPNETAVLGEAAHSLYMLKYTPQKGDKLTIGMAQEPKTLFLGTDTMSAMTQVTSLLYGGLVGGFDENWCLYPELIKTVPTQENGLWKVFIDGTMEVVYELRKGIKWSDGVEITAEDAKFGFYLTFHPAFPIIHTQIDKWVDKVEVIDKYKIKVFWNNSYLYANTGITIMPKHYFKYDLEFDLNDMDYYREDDPDTFEDETYKSDKYLEDEEFISKAVEGLYKERPLHCGPYKVVEWERGDHIILEMNDNFLYGKALIDRIEFNTIENSETILEKCKKGDIDVTLVGITFDQALELNDYSKVNEESLISIFTDSLTWEHIDLNVDDEIFSDINIRKALILSINRKQIVDKIFGAKYKISHSWLPPKNKSYVDNKITKYNYDPIKAGKLLDSSGWKLNEEGYREKDGENLKITFMTTAQNRIREQVQEEIKKYWEKIGIEIEKKNEIPTTFFTRTLMKRQFNGPTACMYAWIMGPYSNLYSLLHSTQVPSEKNGYTGQNYTGYSNTKVDEYLNRIIRSMDEEEIADNLTKVQEIITDELPSLPLYIRADVNAAKET